VPPDTPILVLLSYVSAGWAAVTVLAGGPGYGIRTRPTPPTQVADANVAVTNHRRGRLTVLIVAP
jgi:hypothetical protein